MLTYKCKSCAFSFSEADKAWDIAIARGVCPKRGKDLENFFVSETDSQLIRKSHKVNNLRVATESLADSIPTVKHLMYIGCLFILILVIMSGKSSSFFEGRGAGVIIIGAIAGLLILIKFVWTQLKKNHSKSGG